MTNEFSHLNLHPKLVQAVADLGYTTPTDVQAQVIPLMLAGRAFSGRFLFDGDQVLGHCVRETEL